MTEYNLTDEQVAVLLNANKSIVDKLLGSPFFWICLILILVIIIIYLWKSKQKKDDPSTKPFWGREVRQDVLQKEYSNRMNVLSKPSKIQLEWGTTKVGQIEREENDHVLVTKPMIDSGTKKVVHVPDYYHAVRRFKFRKHGIIAMIMAMLFNKGWQYITVTPDVMQEYKHMNKTIYRIKPEVHLLSDSGVWTINDKRIIDANNEFVLKAHDENIHGFTLDYTRRLSVQAPAVGSAMEKSSHDARLKEEERKSRIQSYTS